MPAEPKSKAGEKRKKRIKPKGKRCKECGSQMFCAGRCWTCPSCGASSCY